MSSKHSYKIRKERCNECYGVGQIKLERVRKCENCDGSCCYKCEKRGTHHIYDECPYCLGDGSQYIDIDTGERVVLCALHDFYIITE